MEREDDIPVSSTKFRYKKSLNEREVESILSQDSEEEMPASSRGKAEKLPSKRFSSRRQSKSTTAAVEVESNVSEDSDEDMSTSRHGKGKKISVKSIGIRRKSKLDSTAAEVEVIASLGSDGENNGRTEKLPAKRISSRRNSKLVSTVVEAESKELQGSDEDSHGKAVQISEKRIGSRKQSKLASTSALGNQKSNAKEAEVQNIVKPTIETPNKKLTNENVNNIGKLPISTPKRRRTTIVQTPKLTPIENIMENALLEEVEEVDKLPLITPKRRTRVTHVQQAESGNKMITTTPKRNARQTLAVTPQTNGSNPLTPRRSVRKSIKPTQDYDDIVNKNKRIILEQQSSDEILEENVESEPKWTPAKVGRTSEKRGRKKKQKNKATDTGSSGNDESQNVAKDKSLLGGKDKNKEISPKEKNKYTKGKVGKGKGQNEVSDYKNSEAQDIKIVEGNSDMVNDQQENKASSSLNRTADDKNADESVTEKVEISNNSSQNTTSDKNIADSTIDVNKAEGKKINNKEIKNLKKAKNKNTRNTSYEEKKALNENADSTETSKIIKNATVEKKEADSSLHKEDEPMVEESSNENDETFEKTKADSSFNKIKVDKENKDETFEKVADCSFNKHILEQDEAIEKNKSIKNETFEKKEADCSFSKSEVHKDEQVTEQHLHKNATFEKSGSGFSFNKSEFQQDQSNGDRKSIKNATFEKTEADSSFHKSITEKNEDIALKSDKQNTSFEKTEAGSSFHKIINEKNEDIVLKSDKQNTTFDKENEQNEVLNETNNETFEKIEAELICAQSKIPLLSEKKMMNSTVAKIATEVDTNQTGGFKMHSPIARLKMKKDLKNSTFAKEIENNEHGDFGAYLKSQKMEMSDLGIGVLRYDDNIIDVDDTAAEKYSNEEEEEEVENISDQSDDCVIVDGEEKKFADADDDEDEMEPLKLSDDEEEEEQRSPSKIPKIIITSAKAVTIDSDTFTPQKERRSKPYRLPTPYKTPQAIVIDDDDDDKSDDLKESETEIEPVKENVSHKKILKVTNMGFDEYMLRSVRKRSISLSIRGSRKNVTFNSPANQTAIIEDFDLMIENKQNALRGKSGRDENVTKRKKRSTSLDDRIFLQPKTDIAGITPIKKQPSPLKNNVSGLTPNKKKLTPYKPSASGLTPSKEQRSLTKSAPKPTKLPNFAAIHKKQFAKMESLVDHIERKAERAKALATSLTKNWPNSAKKEEKKKTTDENKPKALRKINLEGVAVAAVEAIKMSKQETSTEAKENFVINSLPTPKFIKQVETKPGNGSARKPIKRLNPVTKSTTTKPPFNLSTHVSSNLASVMPTVSTKNPHNTTSRDAQPMKADKVNERRQRHMDMFKGRIAAGDSSAQKSQRKEIIKGVRGNRRFELMMQNRREHN